MPDIPPLVLQSIGSLVAILVLAGLARAMGLGVSPPLSDEGDVREAAAEVEDGFTARRISISRGGTAALARDDEGRIMLIKSHGNRFAGRILGRGAKVREEVDALIVDCRDKRFGLQRLSLDDAGYWADAINRL
ncbi:MAG: hypothetical protein WA985_10300 [Erythrobacter sp.]|uniref:hypothetical protein n=1 Tax=Erythrobacter sp. TaxID=1042 RepID=UPI003C727DCD